MNEKWIAQMTLREYLALLRQTWATYDNALWPLKTYLRFGIQTWKQARWNMNGIPFDAPCVRNFKG